MKHKNFYLLLLMTSLLSGITAFVLMSFYINTNLQGVVASPTQKIQKEITSKVSNKLPCTNCVYITKSNNINNQGSPLLIATIFTNKQIKQQSFSLISGRSYTQKLDRNIAGNKSPLPNGTYNIGKQTKGLKAETGGVFLPFTPNFITQRSDLGVHVDPSWGLANGENGTQGCLAFKTLKEFNQFVEVITFNNITTAVIDF
jgi:hypothetical protein